MSVFLIKVGKAWQAIRREGLFRASRRICAGVFTALRPVGKGDILFVSGGVGDSALYRTAHVAEELRYQGFRCGATVQDNPFLKKYVNRFSVFVFHRVLYTDHVAQMIAEIKKQGKKIIFDADDLVHDPAYVVKYMDFYQQMNALERKLYDNGVGGEILRDTYVHVATTTTHFLAEKLRGEGKKVFIVPNKLSSRDVQNARDALRKVSTMRMMIAGGSKKVYIGYFSGTISHNKDFATITDALMQIMERYSHVELLLVGPLDVENALVQKYGTRITQLPYAKRSKHFFNIARCDINVAPLEYDNPFCQAKSELKFFEAGIVKVPTVAVANETFTRAIDDGVDGFVARDTDEWVEKLARLVEDAELRHTMGDKACAKAMKNYTTQNAQNAEYYAYMRQH